MTRKRHGIRVTCMEANTLLQETNDSSHPRPSQANQQEKRNGNGYNWRKSTYLLSQSRQKLSQTILEICLGSLNLIKTNEIVVEFGCLLQDSLSITNSKLRYIMYGMTMAEMSLSTTQLIINKWKEGGEGKGRDPVLYGLSAVSSLISHCIPQSEAIQVGKVTASRNK